LMLIDTRGVGHNGGECEDVMLNVENARRESKLKLSHCDDSRYLSRRVSDAEDISLGEHLSRHCLDLSRQLSFVSISLDITRQ
jgi:hypothetical protein